MVGAYKTDFLDIVGVGIGPFNLSLAALLQKTKIRYNFFDQKKEFSWHEGMLLDNAKLQVHFLKDLASCIDPSNPYTFISYLCDKGRIYQFLNRKNSIVSRLEFSDYLKWAIKKIPYLYFNEKVLDVSRGSTGFNLITEYGQYRAKNIVIGTGITPYVPDAFVKFMSDTFFHNAMFKKVYGSLDLSGKSVAIIEGGQSGAEIFEFLISQANKPAQVIWASKRINFRPLEDNCFANEFYTPHYVDYFYHLPSTVRKNKLKELDLTSNGITQAFSDYIYDKIYELKYISPQKVDLLLLTNRKLVEVEKQNHRYLIKLFNQDLGVSNNYLVDIVILATGYRSYVPECFHQLLPKSKKIDELPVKKDYSLDFGSSRTGKIFIQNGAQHTHGIADPNLSLAAWRNAVIINALANAPIYKIQLAEPIVKVDIEQTIFQDNMCAL